MSDSSNGVVNGVSNGAVGGPVSGVPNGPAKGGAVSGPVNGVEPQPTGRARRRRRFLPRRITLRARLTMIYGGLFFAGGVVLLGVTYALLTQQLDGSGQKVLSGTLTGTGTPSAQPTGEPQNERTLVTGAGSAPPSDFTDLDKWMGAERDRLRDVATSSLLTQGASRCWSSAAPRPDSAG